MSRFSFSDDNLSKYQWILIKFGKRPCGRVVSPPDFGSHGPRFKSCWRHCMALYCTEPFIIILPSSHYDLTLKMLRKPASENVVCLCRLLNILANSSNLFLHTGKQCRLRSDCSGSTLFAEMTFKITSR